MVIYNLLFSLRFRISLFSFLHFIFLRSNCFAQHLLPNFNAAEYGELLKLAERTRDTPWTRIKSTPPVDCELVYACCRIRIGKPLGSLEKKDNVGIIVIRGTNGTAPSWLENFYAGMIPAQGTVKLGDSTAVPYKVAEDPKAYVLCRVDAGSSRYGTGNKTKDQQNTLPARHTRIYHLRTLLAKEAPFLFNAFLLSIYYRPAEGYCF